MLKPILDKILGKWASVVSTALILGVLVVNILKPGLLDSPEAMNILAILGIHAGASASAVVRKEK